jgi:hypothetical protein
MTPEGRVKKKIKIVLDKYKLYVYYEMPVPTGYGKSGLDFTGCASGLFFVIEAKAPGEWLTPRQRQRAKNIFLAGGKVFVVSNDDGLGALERWLISVRPVASRSGRRTSR